MNRIRQLGVALGMGVALSLVTAGGPAVAVAALASPPGALAARRLPPTAGVVRVVCDDAGSGRAIGACRADRAVRVEGAGPTGRAEVDAAYDQLGRVADFYSRLVPGGDLTRLIGSDSGDGLGRALRLTVRACSDWRACPMRNAFWSQGEGAMFLGAGFAAAFDVIAHELTHGVTAATSGLVYSGQSGAINESLSDMFAELAEQVELGRTDWAMGEDLRIPGVPTPVRDLADPTRALHGRGSGQPDRMGSPLYQRALSCGYANDFCYVHTDSGVGNKTGYLITVGGTFNGQSIQGIGAVKAAALYWQVEGRLGSHAGYADLGRALVVSCGGLAATPGSGFTSVDCANVQRATWATELLPAPVPGPALAVVWPDSLARPVVVTGSVTGRPAGTVVTLRRHALLHWVTLARGVTDGSGAFRLTWSSGSAPRGGRFRVEVAAAGRGAPAIIGAEHRFGV